MGERFKIGDHVARNSVAGHVSGRIMRGHIDGTDYKGYTHHASLDDPPYEVEHRLESPDDLFGPRVLLPSRALLAQR